MHAVPWDYQYIFSFNIKNREHGDGRTHFETQHHKPT